METGSAAGSNERIAIARVTGLGTVLGAQGKRWWDEKGETLAVGIDFGAQLPPSWSRKFRETLNSIRQDKRRSRRVVLLATDCYCELTSGEGCFVVRVCGPNAIHLAADDAFNALPVAALIVENNEVRAANPAAATLVGARDTSQLLCLNVRELFPAVEDFSDLLQRCAESSCPVAFRDFSGNESTIQLSSSDVDKSHVLCLLPVPESIKPPDTGDSRLAGLGMLVAGVAHEINNPLTFVLPALKDAVEVSKSLRGQPQEELTELLTDALRGVERVAKIASDLREFKRSDEAFSRTDVNEVVVETLKLANARLRGTVSLRHILGIPPQVMSNNTRLGQVILNLILNAAQAMPDREPEKSQIVVRTWGDGEHVHVAVEDNGTGIPRDKISKIFDPFFSTKNAGTGLGLSVCAGFVKRMGGWIEVDSHPGRGSTFTVILPTASSVTATNPAPNSQRPPSLGPAPTSRERTKTQEGISILVVDDEPLVLRSVKRMLGRSATIMQATGGWEAIRKLKDGLVVDYVVSDMVMPEGGGHELWTWIKENRLDLRNRFCFMTGMAPPTEPDPALPPTIHKPFSVDELEQTLEARSTIELTNESRESA